MNISSFVQDNLNIVWVVLGLSDVTEKGLLVTRVRSIKHVEITIPNSLILGSHIVNDSTAVSCQTKPG